MDSVVQALLAHGVLGIVILGMGWWILRQDGAIRDERAAHSAETQARIDDAKEGSQVALRLQAQVIDAVNKCALILDEIRQARRQQP